MGVAGIKSILLILVILELRRTCLFDPSKCVVYIDIIYE